jgi:flagellar capping protein FliD
MIKVIKVGNFIYENIEPKTLEPIGIDENGNPIEFQEKWNIPTDPAKLKFCILDTLGWVVSQKIQKTLGSIDKKDASTTKAIVLLAKVISSLNPDLSNLTENEKKAFELLTQLGNIGYSDSTLLINALQSVQEHILWFRQKLGELEQIDITAPDALDKLIEFLESLDF